MRTPAPDLPGAIGREMGAAGGADVPLETATASKIDSISVTEDDGETRSIEVFALRLRDTTVHLSSLGAAIVQFLANAGDGDVVDIVAGYKDAETYRDTGNPPYFNAVVGRVANRIAGGAFRLGDRSHSVFANEPPHSLHGGGSEGGISHQIWDAAVVRGGSAVRFVLRSPDGDGGFPGTVVLSATYGLRPSFSSSGVVLQLELEAALAAEPSGAAVETPINLASHAYFNLGDREHGILEHALRLESESYAPVDARGIPTREIRAVSADPVMDFRREKNLREALQEYGTAKLGLPEEESAGRLAWRRRGALPSAPYGFDHNYVVRRQPGAALPRVGDVAFGRRRLTVYSDAPGVQVYTANHLGEDRASSSAEVCKRAYGPWEAICLETQHFPDSICSDDTVPRQNKDFWAGRCPILSRDAPTYRQTMALRLEMDRSAAEAADRGSDTEGNKYASIEDMWKAQDLSSWYARARGWYEDHCDATVDGVLGGIGRISDADLEGSRRFLRRLGPLPQDGTGVSRACECGAGIGRVTAGLLLDVVDRVDLVESSPRLLSAAPAHVGDGRAHRCRFFCAELQDWEPGAGQYAVIWVQWTLCYLTDFDIVRFLRRCAAGLVEGGWIVLKENACAGEAFVVDVADASVTRSLDYWLDLVAKSGLRAKHVVWQDDFPEDIFPVPMIALQK